MDRALDPVADKNNAKYIAVQCEREIFAVGCFQVEKESHEVLSWVFHQTKIPSLIKAQDAGPVTGEILGHNRLRHSKNHNFWSSRLPGEWANLSWMALVCWFENYEVNVWFWAWRMCYILLHLILLPREDNVDIGTAEDAPATFRKRGSYTWSGGLSPHCPLQKNLWS